MSAVYILWQQYSTNLPWLSRYTIGAKIDHLSCDVLEQLLFAAYSPRSDKLPFILQASVKFDALKFFLHITWELKLIDTKKYSSLSEPLSEVGKQIGKWMASLK
jgi:hypothetical protein